MTGFQFPEPTEEMVRRYDLAAPRYTSYPTVPEWTGDFGPREHAQKLEEAGREGAAAPLSMYVHLPFFARVGAALGWLIHDDLELLGYPDAPR